MDSRILGAVAVATAMSIAACATTPTPGAVNQSILLSSHPAAGSTISQRLDKLLLVFSPPARLDEVTISGPDGSMPMMLTPIGELSKYTLPVSELGRGNYRVTWRAASRGQAYQGSFNFAVR